VTGYNDLRSMLDDDSIDAVSIATPNHWHSLMGIWACQAGKDVYVEKPISHSIWEGRQLVRAAERYERIVQCGTQCRSNPGLMDALAYVRDGGLGEILVARGLCYKPRQSIGKVERPTAVPESIDYDLWCGPAPMEPLGRERLHYDWHWVWPTGNGDLGNQGIHQMDMCRMALGEGGLPTGVFSIGGRLGYRDDGTTPNSLMTVFEYRRAPLVFEVRGLPRGKGEERMDRFLGASIGIVVQCEKGNLVVDNYRGGRVFDHDGALIEEFDEGGDHYANFIEAMGSRDASDLNGPIEQGHISSALCHMGNVSYRTGVAASAETMREELEGDAVAMETFERLSSHLAANGVDLGDSPAVLGARLKFDPETERFLGDTRANDLVRRSYRAPFTVPERV
jgi:predicted dehydrogenase